jgi:hypothetical protein
LAVLGQAKLKDQAGELSTMQIESGSTSWWRNRNLMFLGMLLAFATYFAYDGLYAWPNKNLDWAAQAMGERPPGFHANPRVQTTVLPELRENLKKRGAISFVQLVDMLKAEFGEPSLVRGGARGAEAGGSNAPAGEEYWWVGPAMYAKASIRDGKPDLAIEQSREHSENSIRGQKWFALLLAGLGGLVGLNLVRVLKTRVTLNDEGLHYNRRHISWDAMTGLRTQDYDRKYWVDLEYTAGDVTRSIRLDSFHINKFNEILTAICERKGFACPDLTSKSKTRAEDAGSAQT